MTERFYTWLAWKLPRRLVMWCAVRVNAHATGPLYPEQVVPELTAMTAILRWEAGAHRTERQG